MWVRVRNRPTGLIEDESERVWEDHEKTSGRSRVHRATVVICGLEILSSIGDKKREEAIVGSAGKGGEEKSEY